MDISIISNNGSDDNQISIAEADSTRNSQSQASNISQANPDFEKEDVSAPNDDGKITGNESQIENILILTEPNETNVGDRTNSKDDLAAKETQMKDVPESLDTSDEASLLNESTNTEGDKRSHEQKILDIMELSDEVNESLNVAEFKMASISNTLHSIIDYGWKEVENEISVFKLYLDDFNRKLERDKQMMTDDADNQEEESEANGIMETDENVPTTDNVIISDNTKIRDSDDYSVKSIGHIQITQEENNSTL